MKKHILISLLIISPTFMHAMELETSSFLNSFSFSSITPTWFSSNQTPKESKLITNLRAKRNALENKLRNDKVKNYLAHDNMLTLAHPFNMFTISNPDKLLQYCYYLKFHNSEFNLRLFELDNRIINDCKKAQLDGYSALGASIIADDTTTDEKRNFIQKLIHLGFKSTPKDIELAELALYDNIPTKQKKTILLFLSNHQENNLSLLLPEIKTQIIQYMLQTFRNEFYLLPETTLNDV